MAPTKRSRESGGGSNDGNQSQPATQPSNRTLKREREARQRDRTSEVFVYSLSEQGRAHHQPADKPREVEESGVDLGFNYWSNHSHVTDADVVDLLVSVLMNEPSRFIGVDGILRRLTVDKDKNNNSQSVTIAAVHNLDPLVLGEELAHGNLQFLAQCSSVPVRHVENPQQQQLKLFGHNSAERAGKVNMRPGATVLPASAPAAPTQWRYMDCEPMSSLVLWPSRPPLQLQDLREIPATACFQQHHLYFRADPGGYDVGFQQDTTAVAPFETLLSQVTMSAVTGGNGVHAKRSLENRRKLLDRLKARTDDVVGRFRCTASIDGGLFLFRPRWEDVKKKEKEKKDDSKKNNKSENGMDTGEFDVDADCLGDDTASGFEKDEAEEAGGGHEGRLVMVWNKGPNRLLQLVQVPPVRSRGSFSDSFSDHSSPLSFSLSYDDSAIGLGGGNENDNAQDSDLYLELLAAVPVGSGAQSVLDKGNYSSSPVVAAALKKVEAEPACAAGGKQEKENGEGREEEGGKDETISRGGAYLNALAREKMRALFLHVRGNLHRVQLSPELRSMMSLRQERGKSAKVTAGAQPGLDTSNEKLLRRLRGTTSVWSSLRVEEGEVGEEEQPMQKKAKGAVNFFSTLDCGSDSESDEDDGDKEEKDKDKEDKKSGLLEVVGIDCEMCVTESGSELTRLTCVCPLQGVVLDMLVRPMSKIVDYVTDKSGITAETLKDVKATMTDAHRALARLIGPDTYVVGHSLEGDLKALRLTHARCIDTAALYPHEKGLPFKQSLKTLALRYLGKHVQQVDGPESGQFDNGHDSVEDAAAALELALQKAVCESIPGEISEGAARSVFFEKFARFGLERGFFEEYERTCHLPAVWDGNNKRIARCTLGDLLTKRAAMSSDTNSSIANGNGSLVNVHLNVSGLPPLHRFRPWERHANGFRLESDSYASLQTQASESTTIHNGSGTDDKNKAKGVFVSCVDLRKQGVIDARACPGNVFNYVDMVVKDSDGWEENTNRNSSNGLDAPPPPPPPKSTGSEPQQPDCRLGDLNSRLQRLFDDTPQNGVFVVITQGSLLRLKQLIAKKQLARWAGVASAKAHESMANIASAASGAEANENTPSSSPTKSITKDSNRGNQTAPPPPPPVNYPSASLWQDSDERELVMAAAHATAGAVFFRRKL